MRLCDNIGYVTVNTKPKITKYHMCNGCIFSNITGLCGQCAVTAVLDNTKNDNNKSI